jgi:hypothetical protein
MPILGSAREQGSGVFTAITTNPMPWYEYLGELICCIRLLLLAAMD